MVINLSACTPSAQTANPIIDSEEPANSPSAPPPEDKEVNNPDSSEEVVFLISGQIDSTGAKLDPLLEKGGTANPPRNGPYKLQALDNNDEILLEYPFSTATLSHTNDEVEQFTFSIGINKKLLEEISAYRIVAIEKGGETELTRIESAQTDVAAPEIIPVSVERLKGGLVKFTWDNELYPRIIIRDAPQGNVLTIAEGGEVLILLTTNTNTFYVTFSDGIHNETRNIEIPQR